MFSDLFVVAKIKHNNTFKMKNILSDMRTASRVDELIYPGLATVDFVATFSSPEPKDNVSLLRRYISLEKADYPKSIPLKISTKDTGNCAYSKTIMIRNSDTANEVIVSLPMLEKTGTERDHRCWVSSAKKRHLST